MVPLLTSFKKLFQRSGLIGLALIAGWTVGERTAAAGELVDRIVAVVNDDIITLYDLEMAMRPYRNQIDELGYDQERAHAGISRRVIVDDLVEILEQQVLNRHQDHVLLDLSWVVFEDYLVDRDVNGQLKQGKDGDVMIRQAWLDLIHKFPRNFLLGSDKVGDFRTYRKEIRKFNPLLKQLRPEVRDYVARLNWLRIVPAQGLSLPVDYKYPENRYIQKSPPHRMPLTPARQGPNPAPDARTAQPVILP